MAAGKKVSYTETVVRNLKTSEKFYGFLPPHGKRLQAFGDSLKRDYYTFKGDIETFIGRRKRYIDAYNRAVDATAPYIRVTENKRVVYYAAVSNSQAFTAGDLCYWDSGSSVAKPASQFTWDTNLATTQTAFKAVCLGVALESKTANDGKVFLKIDISGQSFFDFQLTAGSSYQIGQTFAPAKASGNALLSNKLVAAASSASCARLVTDVGSSDTSLLVTVNSADRKSVV